MGIMLLLNYAVVCCSEYYVCCWDRTPAIKPSCEYQDTGFHMSNQLKPQTSFSATTELCFCTKLIKCTNDMQVFYIDRHEKI